MIKIFYFPAGSEQVQGYRYRDPWAVERTLRWRDEEIVPGRRGVNGPAVIILRRAHVWVGLVYGAPDN